MKVSLSPQHGQQSCYETLGQDLSGPHCGARTKVDPVLKRLNSDDLVSEGESSLRAPIPLRMIFGEILGSLDPNTSEHSQNCIIWVERSVSLFTAQPTPGLSSQLTWPRKQWKCLCFFQLCGRYLGHRSVWAMSVLRERLSQTKKYLHWTSPLDKPEVILQVMLLILSEMETMTFPVHYGKQEPCSTCNGF